MFAPIRIGDSVVVSPSRAFKSLVLGFIVLMCATSPTPALASTGSSVLGSINSLRDSVGAPELVENSSLDAVAQNWANQMASGLGLAHNPNMLGQIPPGWHVAGENVGVGQTLGPLMGAFDRSPHHYENMVNRAFNSVGVGVSAAGGNYYVVVDFASYSGVVSPPARVSKPRASSTAPTTSTQSPKAAHAPSEPGPSAPSPNTLPLGPQPSVLIINGLQELSELHIQG